MSAKSTIILNLKIKLSEDKSNRLSYNFAMKYWDQRATTYSRQYGYSTKMPMLEQIILSNRQDISCVLEFWVAVMQEI